MLKTQICVTSPQCVKKYNCIHIYKYISVSPSKYNIPIAQQQTLVTDLCSVARKHARTGQFWQQIHFVKILQNALQDQIGRCLQRCCWGFRSLWAMTPWRWVIGSRRVYGWRCIIFKEMLDPEDGTAILRNIGNNSPINTASHHTNQNPRTTLVWAEWTLLQQEVETHLDHRQASRRQESQTPLTEANSCPFCTSGTDAPVLGYPALQTTALTASLPKCELTQPTHPCASPPTGASQWHSWCRYHERVSHFYPLCTKMFLFVGSRPMWWSACRLPAGRPELCRSYRYSDMFWIHHTSDTHALTTLLVSSLQMGHSVRLAERHTVSWYTCKRNFINL